MPFDIEGAKRAGASEDQIIEYLTKTRHFDVSGALNAGANKQQIIEYLSNSKPPAFTPKPKSLLEKAGGIAGKALDLGAKFTGIKSAVDLIGSAGEGFQFVANKLFGDEKANERLLAKPQSESMKKANVQGAIAGVKDVAGKSLEVGLVAAPYAKGAQAIAFTGKLATQFPNIARYAGYAAQGAKYGSGFGTAQALQNDKNLKGIFSDAIKGGLTGALVGVAVPAVVEGTVRAAKNIASLYSGVPKEALEKAFNNPEKVSVAVRKYAKSPESTQEILNKANDSFSKIKEARRNAYKVALKNLQETGHKTPIDSETINNGLEEVIGKFNPKVLSSQEVEKLDELRTLYQNWDDFTPLGLDDLRRAIRNRIVIGNSKELNYVATDLENKLKTVVDKADSAIGDMRRSYAEASDFIENLQKEIFGKKSNLSDTTKLNRLLNIFNQKSDVKKELVTRLGNEAGEDLINEITGAVMSTWLPTGWVQRFVLGGLGGGAAIYAGANPATLVAGALGASPRIVGKVTRTLGQINRLSPAANKYGQPLVGQIINKK